MLSPDILDKAKKDNVKYIIVEEELFSLIKDATYVAEPIMSLNTYYGSKIYSMIYSGKKMKILLSDDNKINIVLLKAMLSTEYCTMVACLDGQETLDQLEKAQEEGAPFDIIFLDDNMPNLSGSRALEIIRKNEKSQGTAPVFAVSITGDPNMSEEDKSLYDHKMNKPFKKEDVREAVRIAKELRLTSKPTNAPEKG